MQEFNILRGSINPWLEMELIDDGKYSFQKSLINDALQDSTVTFSMIKEETGILKISNAPANIVPIADGGCEERFIIQYKWKERDTREPGTYKGWFDIIFNGNLSSEGIDYPSGKMRVPIEEELKIIIH